MLKFTTSPPKTRDTKSQPPTPLPSVCASGLIFLPQATALFPGTLLKGAVLPSPLRDPSGLPVSSGLCTSPVSRPHVDASRSIPASSQCSGRGDGGRSCNPVRVSGAPSPHHPPFQSRPGDRAAWLGPRRPDVLTLGLSSPAPARGPAPLPRSRIVLPPSPALARRGHGGEEASLFLRPSPASTPNPRPLVLAPRAPVGLLLSRPLPPTGSVRPWPVSPAGLRRGLSRSGWRWKLVGINPGLARPGVGVGATRRPRAGGKDDSSLCAYIASLGLSRDLSADLSDQVPGPRVWPRARRQARPRSARRSDAS